MQFSFMVRCGTAIFFYFETVTGEAYGKKEGFVLNICDLEKSIGRVPLDTAWWVFKKLVVKEWEVKIVQSIVCTPIPFLLGI